MNFKYSNPAEKEIFELEESLMKDAERLAELKKKQPSMLISDYSFVEIAGQALLVAPVWGGQSFDFVAS